MGFCVSEFELSHRRCYPTTACSMLQRLRCEVCEAIISHQSNSSPGTQKERQICQLYREQVRWDSPKNPKWRRTEKRIESGRR